MRDCLRHTREALPAWLAKHQTGDPVNIQDFLQARILYYPGAGHDGEPVRALVSNHCVHGFIYADYRVSKEKRLEEIKHHGFRGYKMMDCMDIEDFRTAPWEWSQWRDSYPQGRYSSSFEDPLRLSINSCFLAIFERVPMEPAWLGPWYGAERFAVLFVEGDGIFAYEKIFCSAPDTPPPYMLLIKDHGFGGNYDCFGKGGLLEQVAWRYRQLPNFLLKGNYRIAAWSPIYHKVQDAGPVYLDIYSIKRKLWKRKPNCHASVPGRNSMADASIHEDVRCCDSIFSCPAIENK